MVSVVVHYSCPVHYHPDTLNICIYILEAWLYILVISCPMQGATQGSAYNGSIQEHKVRAQDILGTFYNWCAFVKKTVLTMPIIKTGEIRIMHYVSVSNLRNELM